MTWTQARAGQEFKHGLAPAVDRFASIVGRRAVHLDAYCMGKKSWVWSEGNPVPHLFFLVSNGWQLIDPTGVPWANMSVDTTVFSRFPRTPQKWPDGTQEYTATGYTLNLGDHPVQGTVHRQHPKDALSTWTLQSQIAGADHVIIDNPHSGLILTCVLAGKPLTAPVGGLYGPLITDPSRENVAKCLSWLEATCIDVRGDVHEQIDRKLNDTTHATGGFSSRVPAGT